MPRPAVGEFPANAVAKPNLSPGFFYPKTD